MAKHVETPIKETSTKRRKTTENFNISMNVDLKTKMKIEAGLQQKAFSTYLSIILNHPNVKRLRKKLENEAKSKL